MNGIEKAKVQERKGTRPILDDIDELRMICGFDTVEVLTPIVESRLRGGLPTKIPLSLNVKFEEKNIVINFSFEVGYPNVPIVVSVTASENISDQLQLFATHIANKAQDNGHYSKAIYIVRQILDKINEINETDDSFFAPVEIVETTDHVPPEIAALDTEIDVLTLDNSDTKKDNTTYHCRQCRVLLFSHAELHEHSLENMNNRHCTSYYLTEPPVNMELKGENSNVLGKFTCKCDARVGNWSWSGNQCMCGRDTQCWIAPSFQFTKSKVDVKKDISVLEHSCNNSDRTVKTTATVDPALDSVAEEVANEQETVLIGDNVV